MRNVFLALATVFLIFTVSPAFCESTEKLKEIGMFADEYVGKTFTFDVLITINSLYFKDLEDGTYGLSLCDEKHDSLTVAHTIYALDSTKLLTTINREQAKVLIRTLEKDYLAKRRVTFKITKDNYKGHPYYVGKITSIKQMNKD